MKAISYSNIFATLLFVPMACFGATSDARIFAPADCEFSATFPTTPVVKDHANPSTGDHALQAQTPGDAFPWIVAQCTTGRDRSPPPDVENRLELVRSVLTGQRASDIHSSTSNDTRGSWTKATGKVVIDGQQLTFVAASIAGEFSMMIVSGFLKTAEDNLKFEQFLTDISRLPSTSSDKK